MIFNYILQFYLLLFPLKGKQSLITKRETQVGMKAVLKLVEPYFKTNRSLTVDNFFTSLPLAEKLWAEKLTLVGTVNVIKNIIPYSFLQSKTRTPLSSLFVFNSFLTLTSYVPKKNKSVVLLSTHHHSDDIDYDQVQNKDQALAYECFFFYGRQRLSKYMCFNVTSKRKYERKSCR